jgi:GT2 family glycosyltransferase
VPQTAAIIVNWNSHSLLQPCLEALNRQTVGLDKIIVVDNASEDGSCIDIDKQYQKVTLICLDTNTGFAIANNIGVEETTGYDWIALVNPDAFVRPDWLQRLLEAAKQYPEYACFASRLLTGHDGAMLDGAGDIYHVSGLAWRRGHGQAAAGRGIDRREIFSPCAAAALYRREAFLAVGGFDESYFCYFEDVDLGFRLRLAGYRCLYVPEAVVYHMGSATTGKHSDFTVYHGHRNLVWTYFKNMPGSLLWLYLPQHLFLNLISLLWFTLQGQGRVILKAKWDALKGLPRVLKRRRQIQVNRQVSVWDLRRVMAKGVLTPYLRRGRWV